MGWQYVKSWPEALVYCCLMAVAWLVTDTLIEIGKQLWVWWRDRHPPDDWDE